MKRILLLTAVLVATIVSTGVTPLASAQDDKLSGKWVGTLDHNSFYGRVSLTLKFQKTGNNYEGIWNGREMSNISFDGKNISFSISVKNGRGETSSQSCQGKMLMDEINGSCPARSSDDVTWTWRVEKQ